MSELELAAEALAKHYFKECEEKDPRFCETCAIFCEEEWCHEHGVYLTEHGRCGLCEQEGEW